MPTTTISKNSSLETGRFLSISTLHGAARQGSKVWRFGAGPVRAVVPSMTTPGRAAQNIKQRGLEWLKKEFSAVATVKAVVTVNKDSGAPRARAGLGREPLVEGIPFLCA